MKNKQGLSDIVITLVIVLLSLVAIGVVWVVVNNVIKGGTGGVDINSKCLGTNLDISKVNCSVTGTVKSCSVLLSRSGTSSDAIGGIKMIFSNETAGTTSSAAIDVTGDLAPLVPKIVTQNTLTASTAGLNKVTATPYFKDNSGNVQLCSQTSSFNFVG